MRHAQGEPDGAVRRNITGSNMFRYEYMYSVLAGSEIVQRERESARARRRPSLGAAGLCARRLKSVFGQEQGNAAVAPCLGCSLGGHTACIDEV